MVRLTVPRVVRPCDLDLLQSRMTIWRTYPNRYRANITFHFRLMMSWILTPGCLRDSITIWTGPKAGWETQGEGWNAWQEAPKQTVSLV